MIPPGIILISNKTAFITVEVLLVCLSQKPNTILNCLQSLDLLCTIMENIRTTKLFLSHLHGYRSVNGKLCFGFEECNQFDEAERAGAIALEHTPNDIWAIHSIAHIKEETQRYIKTRLKTCCILTKFWLDFDCF